MTRSQKVPEALVLDASAAIAIVHAEPARNAVVMALRDPRMGDVVVPGHFWLEIANVLVRRFGYTSRQVTEAVQILDAFALRTVDIDRPLWLLAVEHMRRSGLASYDAAYLALADVMNGSLLTLDRALATAAGDRAVRFGPPHRLAESPAPYKTREPSAVWAEFGGYLAELRRQVAAE